jgi:adenine/guanine phosphoribosyltransferase-like PRPP-binding protein
MIVEFGAEVVGLSVAIEETSDDRRTINKVCTRTIHSSHSILMGFSNRILVLHSDIRAEAMMKEW